MAKGQQKSNREVKKPKKTDAEKLKSKSGTADVQLSRMSQKPAPGAK